VLVSLVGIYHCGILLIEELQRKLPDLQKGRMALLTSAPQSTSPGCYQALSDRLRRLGCWAHFNPANEFSKDTGLDNLENYYTSLTLHLSEVYEASFQIETATARLLSSPTRGNAIDLESHLRHITQFHIVFVLMALRWVSDQSSWIEGE
jgi:hypothetical protein